MSLRQSIIVGFWNDQINSYSLPCAHLTSSLQYDKYQGPDMWRCEICEVHTVICWKWLVFFLTEVQVRPKNKWEDLGDLGCVSHKESKV